MEVTFYQTSSGRSPVLEYIKDLPKPDRARVLESLQQIQNFGLDAVRKDERGARMKKNAKRITLKKVLTEELKDKEFKFYFQKEQAISQIAKLVKQARLRAGLTQSQLADLIETSQTVIGRLESGNDLRIPSLDLLQRIAQALHARLLVTFDFGKVA